MKPRDTELHVRGTAQFIDDLPEPEGVVHAAVFGAPVAHGRLLAIETHGADSMPGVLGVLTASDIPGENQIGHIIADEPLLANETIEYYQQPLAVVLALSATQARRAARRIRANLEPLTPVLDLDEALRLKQIIGKERVFETGNVERAWNECALIVEGQVESGFQEHVYLEPQSALALPLEGGRLKVYTSTQSPTAVQRTIARVLGCSMNAVEVEVMRLGGGFGGKEEQANSWASLAALAAYRFKRPVKLILNRAEDISMTGKRHPYRAHFKLGIDSKYKIRAYTVELYQNAGAFCDLSPAILERSLFHATNSYYIPNARLKAVSLKTNIPPNTAFRGFGAPQSMFVIETALSEAARQMGITTAALQEANLIQKGEPFPYGMQQKDQQPLACWRKLQTDFRVADLRKRIEAFNQTHSWQKKGLALMPICFGISFTTTWMNQASALVNIYTDGSISINTGAVEMGQGVHAKLRQIAATIFGIESTRIFIEATNTSRIANSSPTAASTGPDLNGNATLMACEILKNRIIEVARRLLNAGATTTLSIANETICIDKTPTAMNWTELIQKSYWERVSLSAHAFYATPDIFFDRVTEKGRPFAYHVSGCSLTEITLDCLRGIFVIDSVSIVHDLGRPIDEIIDRGQIEGALLQGLGWISMEEILFDTKGYLLTPNLAKYKIPDIAFAPGRVVIHFAEIGEENSRDGILGSKAIGEPPFMYGIGLFFALKEAILAFNPRAQLANIAPLTHERILSALYPQNLVGKESCR